MTRQLWCKLASFKLPHCAAQLLGKAHCVAEAERRSSVLFMFDYPSVSKALALLLVILRCRSLHYSQRNSRRLKFKI